MIMHPLPSEEVAAHIFSRDRSGDFCFVCQGRWPEGVTAVSKYHSCSICGVSVHAECRHMAMRCYQCCPGMTHDKLNDQDIQSKCDNLSGRLYCQLLQAYDLDMPAGSQLYGVFKLDINGATSVTTAIGVTDHGGCMWQELSKSDLMASLPVFMAEQHDHMQTRDAAAVPSKSFIELEIWRSSLFGYFDRAILSSRISLIPLLLHADVCIERWFALKPLGAVEMKPCTVLIKFAFIKETVELSKSLQCVDNVAQKLQGTLRAIQPAEAKKYEDNAVIISSESVFKTKFGENELPEQDITASGIHDQKDGVEADPTYEEDAHEKQSQHNISNLDPDCSVSDCGSANSDAAATTDSTRATAPQAWFRSTRATAPQAWFRSRFSEMSDKASTVFSALLWDEYRALRRARNKIKSVKSQDDGGRKMVSIGKVSVNLLDAYRTDVKDAADGDYFTAVSIVDASGTVAFNGMLLEEDTHVVYNNAAPSFNCKFEFEVPHFRCGVKITLIDANTGRKIGSSYISIHSIIQRDAERLYDKPHKDGKKNSRRWPMNGLMTGMSLTNDVNDAVQELILRDMHDKDVIGHVSASVSFTENVEELFWSSAPKTAGSSPPEAVSVDRLRTHINRFKAIVALFNNACREHQRIMEWEDPLYTFILLLLFVYTTLFIDSEYAISVPLFIIIVLMTQHWYHRKSGKFKRQIIERDGSVDIVPYRPYLYLRMAVSDFKNFYKKNSRNLYPLPQFIKVSYLTSSSSRDQKASLINAANSDTNELLIALIPIAQQFRNSEHAMFNIQSTGPGGITQLLSTLNILKSENVSDGILQNVADPWPRGSEDNACDISYLYPILQPDARKEIQASVGTEAPVLRGDSNDELPQKRAEPLMNIEKDTNNTAPQVGAKAKFQAWTEVDGAIKLTLLGDSPDQSFVDSTLGTITVPLRDLFADITPGQTSGIQPEVRKWYSVKWNNAFINHVKSVDYFDTDDVSLDVSGTESVTRIESSVWASRQPVVQLRFQVDIRKNSCDEEVEISRAIQSILSPNVDKSGGTISTLWNMPENIRYVQNLMGSILDTIESFKNIFNWTVPYKTNFIYWLVVATWIVCVFVPGRYLLLCGGLFDFFYCFWPQPDEYPFDIRLNNILESIPNDDDLEQVFAWERKNYVEKEREKQKLSLKKAKLHLALDCLWEGHVRLKDNGGHLSIGLKGIWDNVYFVLQGSRFVWWHCEEDVDNGQAPLGQLLLFGHAGITKASPLDIREMGDDTRLISIFGKDISGSQRKITVLTKDASGCRSLSTAANIALARTNNNN